jgi:2-polyprenyl-3-methyl-5-hydroxy-6-metoxy-1,4-benzoquinol methylase
MSLIADGPRTVLDIGTGTGAVARPLAPLVERVHAVDWSAAMIEEGRQLPGGDHPNLIWSVGPAETVALAPPYGLVTAVPACTGWTGTWCLPGLPRRWRL